MLAASLPSRLSIALIDPCCDVPRGAAYSTGHPEHVLNVPAIRMGADAPDGFYCWLEGDGASLAARYGAPVSGDAFMPRMLYGDYLTAITREALQRVTRIAHQAMRIEPVAQGYRLHFEGHDPIEAHRLILATGNGFHAKGNATHYYPKPWLCDFDTLARAEASDPIVLIGSGLTAVDTLVSLLMRKVRTPILVISRHAAFPAVHSAQPLSPSPAFDPASLAALPLSQQMRLIRGFINEQVASGYSWQSCIDALRPHTVSHWKTLDDAQRRRFFRHLFSHWNRVRHRMAPTLHPILAAGHHQTIRGSVAAIDGQTVTLHDGQRFAASTIFDCRGPRYRLQDTPLYRALLSQSILSLHPTGMGFALTGPAGRISAETAAPIHAIGPLLLGERLETTAVPELREQVKQLAEWIGLAL